jgi:type II secretion system protein C
MSGRERESVGNNKGCIMYYSLKIQQFCLVVSLSLLLGFPFCPPLSLGGIDLAQANSVLIAKNGSQRLIGTAVSSNPADNFAVIEDIRNKHQWIYREGDQVGETLIKKILPDHILVDNGTGEEVVQLQRSLTGHAARVTGTALSSEAVNTRQNPTRKGGPRDRYYLISGEAFSKAFANPEQLLDRVDMQPGKLLGQQKGVRLGAFAPESLFAALGLRQGDLLLAVNAQEIVAPDQAVKMLQTMLANDEAELKVRRRARTYRFHLQAE